MVISSLSKTERFVRANVWKINNCIANSKKFFIVETIKTSTKGKEIHISCKANLVNKAKDVKSNFKALECETN